MAETTNLSTGMKREHSGSSLNQDLKKKKEVKKIFRIKKEDEKEEKKNVVKKECKEDTVNVKLEPCKDEKLKLKNEDNKTARNNQGEHGEPSAPDCIEPVIDGAEIQSPGEVDEAGRIQEMDPAPEDLTNISKDRVINSENETVVQNHKKCENQENFNNVSVLEMRMIENRLETDSTMKEGVNQVEDGSCAGSGESGPNTSKSSVYDSGRLDYYDQGKSGENLSFYDNTAMRPDTGEMRINSYRDENETENNSLHRMRATQNVNGEGSSVQIGFHQEQNVYGEGPSVKSNNAALGRNICGKVTPEQNVYRGGLGSMAFSEQNIYGEGSSNTAVERNIYGEGSSTDNYTSQENIVRRNVFRELSLNRGTSQERNIYGEGSSRSNATIDKRPIYGIRDGSMGRERNQFGRFTSARPTFIAEELNVYGEGSSSQNITTAEERNIYGEGPSTPHLTTAEKRDLYGECSSSQNNTTVEARNVYGEGSSSQNNTTVEARNVYGEGSSSQNNTTVEARNVYGEGSSSQNNTTVEARNVYGEGSSTNSRITTEGQRNYGEVSSTRIGSNAEEQTDEASEERSKSKAEAAKNALKSLERDGYDGFIPVYGTGTYAVIRALYSEKQAADHKGYLGKREILLGSQIFFPFVLSKTSLFSIESSISLNSPLIKRGLVLRWGSPYVYTLSEKGIRLGKYLEEAYGMPEKGGPGAAFFPYCKALGFF